MIATSTPPQWVLHPRSQPGRAVQLAGELGAPLPIGHALVNRGHADLDAARRFLWPTLDDLHDPAGLKGMQAAVDRILLAIARGETILVQGDYDVDGITSTYVLHTTITELGGRPHWRIPHRTRDGYGLTPAAVDDAKRLGCSLIVTVDCGITAIEAVNHAHGLGIDVVITDHHEPAASLPDACALVNPLQPGCDYPFKSLAGVGVTYKLVEALVRERGLGRRVREFLDLVAVGTIADVVPLIGENRILATSGLERLNGAPQRGLRALMERCNLTPGSVTSGQIAFVLAPRINAAGRMGNAEQALRLLLARDDGEAAACADSLEEDNERRREHDQRAAAEAAIRVEQELGWPECSSIVLDSDEWHAGILGIVASRMVDRFQRPTILVAFDGELGRGSGRSLAGLDLTRILDGCGDLLEGYGGHALAAGLTMRRDRLAEFRIRFEQLVRERMQPSDFVRRLEVDADITLGECDGELIRWMERLAPHGMGNTEPVFRVERAQVHGVSVVGGGKHLRLQLRDATGEAEAIGFGFGDQAEAVREAGVCAIAFAPNRNDWKGTTRVQLKLKGLRLP